MAAVAAAAAVPTPGAAATTTAAAPAAGGSVATAVAGAVVAPMTGTIREVRAEVGAAVIEGDLLFVMEAMKMDIEIPVTSAGRVAEIAVQAGDSVTEAQLLARIDG